MSSPAKKSKVVWIGESYHRDMAEATERLVRIMKQLRVREASICCSNNGTKKRSTPLPPCGFDAPEKYGDFAYEFGSHNFRFLQRIYAISGGRCGCIGVDGDPSMRPHVLCSFRDFWLYKRHYFKRCPPGVCVFAGNCCSFSQQSEAHHGRSIDLVNGAPLTEEQARKIEFGNETLMWISLLMIAAWQANPLCKVIMEIPAGYGPKQPICKDVFHSIFGLKKTALCKCMLFGTPYRKEIVIYNNLKSWHVNDLPYEKRICTASHSCGCFPHRETCCGVVARESADFGLAMAGSLARAAYKDLLAIDDSRGSMQLA